MGPKITLLMPCYNGMKYIAEAVASVIAQSMPDWELIISDDGSKDGSVEYLKSLRDPRISVFIQPKNLGIFGNLNFLFSRAAAPITQILCQDDFLIGANALRQILELWSDLPEKVAFLRCNHGQDGSSGLQPLVQESLPPIIESRDSDLFFFVFGCVPGNLSNVSVRTPVIARMGWFRTDLPFAGDFEFWSRTGRELPWASSRKHVVQVRLHLEQASITLNRKGELLSQLLLILTTLIRELRAQGYSAFDLRLAATILYLVRHLDGGLKVGITGGGWRYFKLVNRSFMGADCFMNRHLSWLMYLISGGGRLFGPEVARRLIASRYRVLARSLISDTH